MTPASAEWTRRWWALADHLAMQACVTLEHAHRLSAAKQLTLLMHAKRIALRRRRAIERADEALARMSPLRVDGGAQ